MEGLAPAERHRLSTLLDEVAELPIGQQHSIMSEVFSIAGRMPAAETLGFRLAPLIPITAYGELTFGIKIAPTIRDALRFVVDWHLREVPLILYGFKEYSDAADFTIAFRSPIESGGEALLVSAAMMILQRELNNLTTHRGYISKIELTDSSRGMEPLYERYLGIRAECGHAINRLILDAAILDVRNSAGDEETFAALVKERQFLNVQDSNPQSMTAAIKEHIAAKINDPPTLENLAKIFRISVRQVRLILQNEGSCYRDILRDVRVQQSLLLFRNQALSVSDVAYRLGYSDVAAFSHGFQRWTGQTPSQARQDVLKNART